MAVRTSLRKKLAAMFLAGSLLTVLLFSLAINRIVGDYFQNQTAINRQFVQDQSRQEVRRNLAVFKDRIQQTFSGGTVALTSLSESGLLGDRLQLALKSAQEREAIAKMLQVLQRQARLSLVTVVAPDGKVVVRATNPAAFGDDVLVGDYVNPNGRVSSIRHLVQTALTGKSVTGFEAFPPETLALENYVKDGKVISSLKDFAAISLIGHDVPPGSLETRVLVLTHAEPVLDSRGKTVGVVIAGRVINKDTSIVQDIRSLLRDHATFFLGQVRVSTTRTEQPVGTRRDAAFLADAPLYNTSRETQRKIEGEELMGVLEPIKDLDGVVLGSLYIGRPMSLVDAISKAQEEVQNGVERKRQLYVITLAVISLIIAVVIASIFSKRITNQIDQLRKGAETISDGNLDYRLRINSDDEIEVLGEQFNAMAAKLQESYQTLERKVEERTRQLKESREAMVQQEKMVGIGQLAAGIAHELNTPLGTIIGYAQMLREDLSLQPSVNGNLVDIDEIIGQAGRCRDLVKNLLNFSRRSTTEKAQSDINGIVRKVRSLVEHDFAMKGVRIETFLDHHLPQAKVNENEIAQVVLNLANNAVDSMPDGGDLQLRTIYDESLDRVCIEVHDTGCGISESDRKRVFEPFFTTKDVGKGTGLGLSICYKIVENHLGTMEFDSVIGKGTTFRVFIPVNAEVQVA